MVMMVLTKVCCLVLLIECLDRSRPLAVSAVVVLTPEYGRTYKADSTDDNHEKEADHLTSSDPASSGDPLETSVAVTTTEERLPPSSTVPTGTEEGDTDKRRVLTIALSTTGGVLALLLALTAGFCLRKRKLWCFSDQKTSSGGPVIAPASSAIKAVPVAQVEKCFQDLFNDDFAGLKAQYQELEVMSQKLVSSGYMRHLSSKVKLKKSSSSPSLTGDEKVQVSEVTFLKGCQSPQEYLVTNSVHVDVKANFFETIWKENVCFVVMLTQCKEQQKVHCVQYWPANGEKEVFGEMTVTNVFENLSDPLYFYREIQAKWGSRTRVLHHFQFSKWPHGDCPDSILDLLSFIDQVRTKINQHSNPGPILVHCSKDFGRTGTFIALDQALQEIEERKTTINVFEKVMTLRQIHFPDGKMVGNITQYIFIFKCVREYLKHKNDKGRKIALRQKPQALPQVRPQAPLPDSAHRYTPQPSSSLDVKDRPLTYIDFLPPSPDPSIRSSREVDRRTPAPMTGRRKQEAQDSQETIYEPLNPHVAGLDRLGLDGGLRTPQVHIDLVQDPEELIYEDTRLDGPDELLYADTYLDDPRFGRKGEALTTL